MTLVALPGTGIWVPYSPPSAGTTTGRTLSDTLVLDADEEEAQWIASVTIAGGGSKTFGTSGSSLGWLPGPSLTFAAGATLRVGIKTASKIDQTAGPPARATIGAAAFDVYTNLLGGTDTLTATTWRTDVMTAGTPVTITDGELLAVCAHLDIASGTHNVKLRGLNITANMPAATLVTSGPTYSAQPVLPNLLLTFDDGTLGWLDPCHVFATGDTPGTAIGLGNIHANIMQFPFPCAVDMVAAGTNITTGGDGALDLYGLPLGTPTLLASIAVDANVLAATGQRMTYRRFATPQVLEANTAYALGIRQTQGAATVSAFFYDVADPTHFASTAGGAVVYAAHSTGGATFVAQNSGRRRYLLWMRISHLDNGISVGGVGRRLAIGVP